MQTAIDPQAVYITPTGRRCRWVPLGGARGAWTAHAYFRYLSTDTALEAGFTLAPKNYGILRKEVEHASAR